MALRAALASAVVSRRVGRGRNRLGAFFVRVLSRCVGFSSSSARSCSWTRCSSGRSHRSSPATRTSSGSRKPAPGCSSARTAPARCSAGCPAASRPRGGARSAPSSRGSSCSRSRASRFAPPDSAVGTRRRPVRPGLLEHHDLGRRARLDHRRDTARASGRDDRHGFGVAVFGAILGPMFGAVAESPESGSRSSPSASSRSRSPARRARPWARGEAIAAVCACARRPEVRRRALAQHAPRLPVRALVVLAPLALDDGGSAPSRSARSSSARARRGRCSTRCSAASRPPRPAASRSGRSAGLGRDRLALAASSAVAHRGLAARGDHRSGRVSTRRACRRRPTARRRAGLRRASRSGS